MDASSQVSGSTPQRIALWDNARFVLIVLVVVGHAISTVRSTHPFGFGLYAFIYLFHMPAMILLSGVFTKAETSPKAVRSVFQLLITWLIWEGVWVLLRLGVLGDPPGSRFLVVPSWTLWFLVTLITMRILLPYLARLRHPFLVSVGLALGAGLLPAIGTEFSASRTLCFLPFFVGGWLVKQRGLLAGDWFTRPRPRTRAFGWAWLGLIALAFLLTPQLRSLWRIDKWVTWRDGYERVFAAAPIGDWAPTSWIGTAAGGILVAAVLLTVAGTMIFALLLIVPRGHSVITIWGTRTLFVYLLHGPIIWALRQLGILDTIAAAGLPGMIAIILGAIALTVLLSGGWVQRATRLLIEPRISWMLLDAQERQGTQQGSAAGRKPGSGPGSEPQAEAAGA